MLTPVNLPPSEMVHLATGCVCKLKDAIRRLREQRAAMDGFLLSFTTDDTQQVGRIIASIASEAELNSDDGEDDEDEGAGWGEPMIRMTLVKDGAAVAAILESVQHASDSIGRHDKEALGSLLGSYPKMVGYMIFVMAHYGPTFEGVVTAASHLVLSRTDRSELGPEDRAALECLDDRDLLSTASILGHHRGLVEGDLMESGGIGLARSLVVATGLLQVYMYQAMCLPRALSARTVLDRKGMVSPASFDTFDRDVCHGIANYYDGAPIRKDLADAAGLGAYIDDEAACEEEERRTEEDDDLATCVTPRELFEAQVASGRWGPLISGEIVKDPLRPLTSDACMQLFPRSSTSKATGRFIERISLRKPEEGRREARIAEANRMLRSVLRGFARRPDGLEEFRRLHADV